MFYPQVTWLGTLPRRTPPSLMICQPTTIFLAGYQMTTTTSPLAVFLLATSTSIVPSGLLTTRHQLASRGCKPQESTACSAARTTPDIESTVHYATTAAWCKASFGDASEPAPCPLLTVHRIFLDDPPHPGGHHRHHQTLACPVATTAAQGDCA